MKKLKLNRETVRNLTNTELGGVLGGNISRVTNPCPVPTNGCTGGSCQITGTISSGTSVINPGTIILPSGG